MEKREGVAKHNYLKYGYMDSMVNSVTKMRNK